MEAAAPLRPLPLPDEVTAPFWEGCRRGELLMQRCGACERYRFHPRPLCPYCRSFTSEWDRVSGLGTLYSFVICHPPVLPAFQASAPYAVGVVELAEDPALRMVGGLLGIAHEQLRIGQRLVVSFEEVADGVVLPQWRPAP